MFHTSSNSVNQYLNEIGSFPQLTTEEMKKLFARYHSGDESAKELLINCNLRLVVQVAKRFSSYQNVSFLDLIQEGNIGLIKSIEKFDETRNFMFSTYSVPWIKQSMQRYIEDKIGAIRLPVHQHEIYKKYIKFLDEYYSKYQITPTKEEVIKALNITETTYDNLIGFYKFNSPFSLDEPINSETESVLGDIIADENNAFIDSLEEDDNSLYLYKIKKLLGNFEYYIIYSRYVAIKRKTQNELADEFGITRARLGQIEAVALNKIALKLDKKRKISIDNEYHLYKKISSFNPTPFSIDDAVALTFFKNTLNKQDVSVIFNYKFSDFPLTADELLNEFGYDPSSKSDFEEYIEFLIKMYDSFKNSEEFKIYKKQILSKFKYRPLMETIDTESKVMPNDLPIFEKLSTISYENFIKMHEEELSVKEKRLLSIYFFESDFSKVNAKDLATAEDEVNLTLNDYFNGNTHIDKEQLRSFYLKNKAKFTSEEQANIEYYLYGLIDLETYNSLIGSSSSRKEYEGEDLLLDILEKEFFGVRNLNEFEQQKYDFSYAQSILNNEDLPLYGNKELFIKLYNMYFGLQEYSRRYSISEISEILGNIYSNEQIENAISSVLLATLKYKKGIRKEKKAITKDEVVEYGRKHWQELSTKELHYIKMLETRNDLSNGSIRAIPKSLKIKLMKQDSNRIVFEFSNSSRRKAIEILRSKRLTKETRNVIMAYYSLNGIDILNGKEKKQIMKIIYTLNKKKVNQGITLKKKN